MKYQENISLSIIIIQIKVEQKFVYVNNEQKIYDYNKNKVIMSFKSSPIKLKAWFDNGTGGTTDFFNVFFNE